MKRLNLLFAIFAVVSGLASAQTRGPMLSVDDMRSDLAALRAVVEQSHPNPYRSANQSAVDRNWVLAERKLTKPMSSVEFLNFIAPLLTQYNDGHTAMDLPHESEAFKAYTKSGGKLFPFRGVIKNEKLYITESIGDMNVDRGSEILSIDGRKTPAILRDLRALAMGDTPAGRDSALARLISLYLWQRYGTGTKIALSIRRPSGQISAVSGSGIDWEKYSGILFGDKPINSYELTPSVYVIEVNKMQSRDEVKKAIDEAFAVVREKGYPHLAIDLRKNGGGNSVVGDWVIEHLTSRPYNQGGTKEVRVSQYLSQTSQSYANWIAPQKERFGVTGDRIVIKYQGDGEAAETDKWVYTGKVHLLTGPRTYSSGFMMAEAFKCYGFGQLVGESPGSHRNLSGEMRYFTLPRSRWGGFVAVAQFFPPCYQKQKSDFIVPDVPVEQSIADLAAGKDTVLEYLKTIAAKEPIARENIAER
jgi:C-terminal processing protease CtpA/Prc